MAAKPDLKNKNATDPAVTAAIDDALAWGRLLQWLKRPELLQSTDKKQIKEALEKYVTDLNHRYGQKISSSFPTNDEWQLLHTLCFQLAKQYGKAKTDFGEWDSVIQLIDGKYKTLGVRDFIETIISRIVLLPVPPCTTIYNALQQSRKPAEQQQWQEIYDVIGSKTWSHRVDSKPWVQWLKLIDQLGLVTGKNPHLLAEKNISDPHAAFIKIREIHDVQLKWMQQFDRTIAATRRWIYLLNNENYFLKLKKVFHGDALSPAEIRQFTARDKNRERRRRSYRKTKKRD